MLAKFLLGRQKQNVLLFVVGCVSIILASGIVAEHVRSFGLKRDTAVMIGLSLPELKNSVALLRSSVEAERVFARQARAAREEQAAAYVLPATSPVPRAVLAIEQLSLALRDSSNGAFTLMSLSFPAKIENHGTHKTLAGIALIDGSFQNVARLLGAFSMAGDMMVRDAISLETEEAFLRQVGVDEPLALKAAQDFLYLDLLEYASAPDIAEQGALSSVSDAVRPDLHALLLEGGLAAVREGLSPVASRLKERKVWPLPLVEVTSVSRKGTRYTVGLRLLSR